MATDNLPQLPIEEAMAPPSGSPDRFTRRWHLVGVGLSNVWRFGDLEMPAPSGRLLMRGPNGTGKTTALEALWPYLLDLNPARLGAGKGRQTTLSQLMREGAGGKRRYGYMWLSLGGPGDAGVHSFGVRLQFARDASPPVRVVPFAVPGRPLHELALHGPGRAALSLEQFTEAVEAAGGQVFPDDNAYVAHICARLWRTKVTEAAHLGARLRAVRNPSLLADVSPSVAAEALRDSLPGVAEDVIAATAEALAESDATRDAFDRDTNAAEVLADFAEVWAGHVVEVIGEAHQAAARAEDEVSTSQSKLRRRRSAVTAAQREKQDADEQHRKLSGELEAARAEVRALERSDAYTAAGRLTDLEATFDARKHLAAARSRELVLAVRAAADRGKSLRRRLAELREDLDGQCRAAATADPSAGLDTLLLAWTDHPRSALSSGEVTVDPGPAMRIDGSPARLADAVGGWQELARGHRRRAADASLALVDHKPVARAEDYSRQAAAAAAAAEVKSDTEQQDARRARESAVEAAVTMRVQLHAWTVGNRDLAAGPDSAADGATGGWSVEDLAELEGAEPAQVLAQADLWAEDVIRRAAALAAAARRDAQGLSVDAGTLRSEAADRRAEAEQLRAGRMLPLPRPEWAGPGDEAVAFAAALDWAENFPDATERARLESALAASGLLGATLHQAGADTTAWSVAASGPLVLPNLADVLVVDPAHPLAEPAAAVLARVPLVATVASPSDDGRGLVIGTDGTFKAGVLHGRAPGTDDPAALPPARHVGARQRRVAALAHAAELDAQADDLEAKAGRLDVQAGELKRRADETEARASRFPLRTRLRAAEATRSAADAAAAAAAAAAHAARIEATRLEDAWREAFDAWVSRTRARSLSTDIDVLTDLRDSGPRTADQLEAAADAVASKLSRRLDVLLAEVAAEADKTLELSQLEAAARAADQIRDTTGTALRTLRETAGADIQLVLEAHRKATNREQELSAQLDPSLGRLLRATEGEQAAQSAFEKAEEEALAAEPRAADCRRALRALLAAPGVSAVIPEPAGSTDDEHLVDRVGEAISGRATSARRTLRERYDQARAHLARVWSLDPGDDVGSLETYVLTHRDTTYTPPDAAARARILAERAQKALAASEERALRDFVIGRLPGAIGTAWTRLHDWVHQVNRKMRSATASSGVGVQVRVELSSDLSPAARRVYELSCRVSDADRTDEQKEDVGLHLQALLAAAEGATMTERLADAVDVRGWVDLHYELARPGREPSRWHPKSGLSSGERRLVVLAPMLAAIAANYDRLGEDALRLAALDEIPAEVDERGREGLARYIAELDLDLLCTSHLWDGAPGAWDGIDAHDLEAGPDDTVVAFPMLVRGPLPLPGDEMIPV